MNNLTEQAGLWWLAFATLVMAGGLYVLFRSVALVRGDQLAVLERRWVGRRMPEGRVVAMRHEVGVQAHILGPGLHFLTPFIYAVTKSLMLEVGEDEDVLVSGGEGGQGEGSSVGGAGIMAAVLGNLLATSRAT